MNKLTILATAVLMLITSCTSTDEEGSLSYEERTQITFAAPVMYGMTRAYEGPKFAPDHTATQGEMLGAKYDINENFTVYGRRYQGNYPGWASSEPVFGAVDADGKGDADYTEVAYLPTPMNGWVTQYPYFFMPDYKYAFAAVSPYQEELDNGFNLKQSMDMTLDNRGLQVTAYYAPETYTTENGPFDCHYDLMYSEMIYDADRRTAVNSDGTTTGGNHNKDYNGVNLKFHHALASVHFKICVDPDFVTKYNAIYGSGSTYGAPDLNETNFRIHSIRIENVINMGDFNQNVTEPPDTKNLTEANTKGSPQWTFVDTYPAEPYYFFWDQKGSTPHYTNIHLPDPVKQTTIAKAATDIVNVKDTTSPYYNSDGGQIFDDGIAGRYGLMIPQRFKAAAGLPADAPDAQIIVEWLYTTVTGDNKETIEQKFKTVIKLSDLSDAWEMGKRYIYTLVMRGELLQVAPSVEQWDDIYNDINL